MSSNYQTQRRVSGYILGVFLILIVTLFLINWIMHPPTGDLITLAIYLSVTSLASAGIGFVTNRLGWWSKIPRLQYALVLGYILASGLILFNVWVTARLMFINQHDFALGSLLLIFAGAISVAFGLFISHAITARIQKVVDSAEKISRGDLSVRVDVDGNDEVARLAGAFNQMVERLEQAAQQEKAIEQTRRNLIAWASHDLRTPLTSLRAMLTALDDGVITEPETVARYLEQSKVEVQRLSRLIDDLFELAQLDAGFQDFDYDWINISDLISDILQSFALPASQKGVALSGHVESDVDPVWGAADKVNRILANLVGNALQHTRRGDKIEIEARVEGDEALVSVRDTGVGILPDDISQIFDPFYRGDKSRKREGDIGGAGLGLAIVKSLVERHGGRIWVESQPDVGSIFWFTLPKQNRKGFV